MLLPREDSRALLGAGSVIKTVQQQSNARAIACALRHDPTGILNVFFTLCAVQRDRDGDGKENESARDCRWNPLRARMKEEAKLTREAKASAATVYGPWAGGHVIKKGAHQGEGESGQEEKISHTDKYTESNKA